MRLDFPQSYNEKWALRHAKAGKVLVERANIGPTSDASVEKDSRCESLPWKD